MKKKILIVGRGGTGKTTSANIIAKETGYGILEEALSLPILLKTSENGMIYTTNDLDILKERHQLKDFTIVELS